MAKFKAPIGAILKANLDPYSIGTDWVYMGHRVTTVGSELHYFSKFVNKAHLSDVWTYTASSMEVLKAKFSNADNFIVDLDKNPINPDIDNAKNKPDNTR